MLLKRPFYIILLITYCFTAKSIFCQPIENHFIHYTPKDGLADGGISSIVQDSSGFLWIGNENGLSRFDGHTFKVYRYNPADTNSLRENRIWNLFIDSKKHLWAITFHWLYLYHPEGDWFEHFGINNLKDDRLEKICAEENRQLIITGRKAIYWFDMTKKKFFFFYQEGLGFQPGGDYYKDEEGIEWICNSNGLVKYNPKTKKSQVDSTLFLANLNFLPNGYLLARSYDQGLFLINRQTNFVQKFFPDKKDTNLLTCYLYKLNDSIFLVGTDHWLSVFNLRTKNFLNIKYDKLNPASLLESNRCIYSIFCDREGIIWLGGQRLEKYDFKDYNIKIMPVNSNEDHVRIFEKYSNIYKCTNGKFILGGYYGMGIYNPLTSQLKKIDDKKLTGKIVDYFQQDARERIWGNTSLFSNHEPKICAFSIKNDTVENIQQYDIPSDRSISDMKLDQKGRLHITTSDTGLLIFDTTDKTFAFFNTNSNSSSLLSSSSTTTLCIDQRGCVWIGTKKGLNKIGQDGITVKQYSQNKNNATFLPDWYVTDIKEDKHGIIWFTTREHGIGRLDPSNDSVRFFSIAEGLPTSWFRELCIDDEDNLWAKSEMGIVNLNVITLQNKLCTEDEGFPVPDDIYNLHYSKYTKKLYILTAYSIFEIDAKSSSRSSKTPQTTITEFSVFDKERPISIGKDIYLKYNENFIDIQFACLQFHSNRQIKYAYKMEGIDNDWVYCNYKRNASYTNLPPGHYVFSVKAQNPGGIWNDVPTLLSIIIKPPVWQTWWFYLAEAIIATAFVLWILRFYTARKLAKQKSDSEKLLAVSNERARIASEMHDELGSGLTSIRMLSEIAVGKIDHAATARSEIEKIEKSATNLSENLREIIWTMNTRFDKLDDFIIYVRSYAVEFFDESRIHFQFSSPDIIPEITLNGELRRNVFLCIKEALNNIMKHSRATEASLIIDLSELTNLVIEIKDNGIGIDAGKMNKSGNGITTMKERLKKFGGSLEMEINGGTRLLFKINI